MNIKELIGEVLKFINIVFVLSHFFYASKHFVVTFVNIVMHLLPH